MKAYPLEEVSFQPKEYDEVSKIYFFALYRKINDSTSWNFDFFFSIKKVFEGDLTQTRVIYSVCNELSKNWVNVIIELFQNGGRLLFPMKNEISFENLESNKNSRFLGLKTNATSNTSKDIFRRTRFILFTWIEFK